MFFPPSPLRGYIEGYYGRLLDWEARAVLLTHLQSLGMNAYLYAPKEDPYHRFHWRRDYPDDWQKDFQKFCATAEKLSVRIIAGIAPGLDYDFRHMTSGEDWQILLRKARMLVERGASSIALLLDDISPPADKNIDEGLTHALLANALKEAMAQYDVPVMLTPRLYADEMMVHDMMAGGADDGCYWPELAKNLNHGIALLVCGRYVVAHDTRLDDTAMVAAGINPERVIVWDNLYAHDYCPRKLYLGRYVGRRVEQNILNNLTGMVATDKLLLSIMAAGEDEAAWREALAAHEVPEIFHHIAPFFDLPPHPETDKKVPSLDNAEILLNTVDTLLWQWKSELALEWYPFLMGLKQDILLVTGQMNQLRKRKSLPDLLRIKYD